MTSDIEVYDWEAKTRDEPRLDIMNKAISSLLVSVRKASLKSSASEPPLSHYAKRAAPVDISDTDESRQFISNHSSSSDRDINEVDPMDYLSDFEQPGRILSQAKADEHELEKDVPRDSLVDKTQRISMEDSTENLSENGETDEEACQICSFNGNDSKMLLCDSCDEAYHLYCLKPPLHHIPQGNWFCPKCIKEAFPGQPQIRVSMEEEESEDHPMAVSESSDSMSPIPEIKEEHTRENIPSSASKLLLDPSPSMKDASIFDKIADSFIEEAETCNQLLIHACSCDAPRCRDNIYSASCAQMKRFLQSAAWASHNDQWLAFPIAAATSELFAYHSLKCDLASCHVPFCADLRGEELV